MASNSSLCGTCNFRQVTKPSVVWCSECDEGFCVECQEHHASAKVTRNHGTIPISDFEKLPSDILKVSTFCGEHNEKYNMYCKKHDCPCCGRCMVENHIECKDVTMLDDVIKDAKSSYAILELEEILAETLENIQKFRKDRQENLVSLQDERENIVKWIHQTRMKINSHFDKIQEDLIKEVHAAEEKESTAIRMLLDQLEKKENDVKELQQTLANLKLHASDLQTYLGTKQIDNDVHATGKSIHELFRDNHSKQVILTCQIDPWLQNISSTIQKFGTLLTTSNQSKFTVASQKHRQAQIEISGQSLSYDSISFQLKRTLNIESQNIRGCSVLPGGKSVFCCYNEDKMLVINPDDSKDFEIDGGAFDVAYVKSRNYVVVTGGGHSRMLIKLVDIKNKKVVKSIEVRTSYDGITIHDDSFILCARGRGIRQLDLGDENFRDIINFDIKMFAFIATFNNNIYYTQKCNDLVMCLDRHGTEKWRFSKLDFLKGPTGIAVDSNGNVFVAGCNSHNVIVISADGQNCRQLLCAKDGIKYPQGLHFDQSTCSLLVANMMDTALLFGVMKK